MVDKTKGQLLEFDRVGYDLHLNRRLKNNGSKVVCWSMTAPIYCIATGSDIRTRDDFPSFIFVNYVLNYSQNYEHHRTTQSNFSSLIFVLLCKFLKPQTQLKLNSEAKPLE